MHAEERALINCNQERIKKDIYLQLQVHVSYVQKKQRIVKYIILNLIQGYLKVIYVIQEVVIIEQNMFCLKGQ